MSIKLFNFRSLSLHLLATCFFTFNTLSSIEPAQAGDKKTAALPQFVTAKIFVKAPCDVVWKAVHEERKHDPDIAYSKVLEEGNHECKLEQKFVLIPMLGSSICQMHQKEVPLERIDYKLIKSDRFKAMEGSWVFSASPEGTTLTLSSHLDLGLPVPKGMLNSITEKKLQRRLNNVKVQAETMARQLAHNKGESSH